MKHRRPTVLLASLAAVAALSSCGGGDGNGSADDGIASLGTIAPQGDTAAAESPPTSDARSGDSAPDDSVAAPAGSVPVSDPPSTDPEEAMLDYVECMREHGIDMPDPEPGGGIAMQVGEGENNPADLQEAEDACQPLLEAAAGVIEIDPEREAEMREQMLAYAECMREHGIEMPDPQFGDNGRVEIQLGDPAGDGADLDVADYETANEACGQAGPGIAIAAGPDGAPPPAEDGS